MSTVITFQSRPVNPLWKPSKRTKAAWRVLSQPSVVEFKLPVKYQAIPPKHDVIPTAMNPNGDLVREIEYELERVINAEDESFENNVDSYDYLLQESDAGEVLKAFKDNYTSRSIGIQEFDEMEGDEIVAYLKGKGLTDEAIVSLLVEHSSIETSDYYIKWNEIYSAPIGEYEYQIDVESHPDLKTLINQASDADLKAAGIEDRESFLAYGHPCDRIIWKIDPKTLLEAVANLGKSA